MTVLSAQTIRDLELVTPCVDATMDSRGCSRGLSACGYDLSLHHDVCVTSLPAAISAFMLGILGFTIGVGEFFYPWINFTCGVIGVLFVWSGWYGISHSFKLAGTAEYFNIPPTVVGRIADKSSLARCGIAVQNTVLEPGWRGYLTVELSNHGWYRLKFKRGDAIAQVLFEWLDAETVLPYAGKYQNQEFGPVGARFKHDS